MLQGGGGGEGGGGLLVFYDGRLYLVRPLGRFSVLVEEGWWDWMGWSGCLAGWRFAVVCRVSLAGVEEPTGTWSTEYG